ncbi:MAG: thioredoxin family protein [Chthonomonadaceae bacterium]|nr:thioredoxin family protein [Chthonomonadaceae bacterium]
MMKPTILLMFALLGGSCVSVLPVQAQKTVKPAKVTPSIKPLPVASVLKKAQSQAKKEKKSVLVIYHASWCGWCKRLDKVMEIPDFKKTISENYVVVHLDVMENGDKKVLENPGGNELMKEMGGEKSGLPFYVFLDEKGKKLADSNVMAKDGNIGYPGAKNEITAFETLLTKTDPRLKPEQSARLVEILKENAPKPQGKE